MSGLKTNVQIIRNAARDVARMQTIEKFMVQRADLRKNKKAVEDLAAEYNKGLKVAEYELSKLDVDHPMYEDKAKVYKDRIEEINKKLEFCTKDLADWDKSIAEVAEKINKVESGETKMLIERVDNIAEDIISAIPSAIANKLEIGTSEDDN